MTDRYEQMITTLRSKPGAEVGRGATEREIDQAEGQLRVTLPEEYKRFLRRCGWACVPGRGDIHGLGADVPWHQDLIRVTISERTEMRPRIPPHLVPLRNDGAGNHHCLDTRRSEGGECPVVFWDHELDEDQEPDELAKGFSLWLSEELVT